MNYESEQVLPHRHHAIRFTAEVRALTLPSGITGVFVIDISQDRIEGAKLVLSMLLDNAEKQINRDLLPFDPIYMLCDLNNFQNAAARRTHLSTYLYGPSRNVVSAFGDLIVRLAELNQGTAEDPKINKAELNKLYETAFPGRKLPRGMTEYQMIINVIFS